MASQSVEEYLEAVYRLGGTENPVSTGELASLLGVAAPSVTTMLKRLVRDGLVEHRRYHGITLTQNGAKLAADLIRSHRLSERLLTDMIGLPWDEVHDVACRLEHVITGDLAERVYKALGEPETCPHGHPMSPEDSPKLVRLNDVAPGTSAVVAMLSNEDPPFLRYVEEMGIKPLSSLKVLSRAPFGGVTSIEVNGGTYAVGAEAASHIWVRTPDEQR